MAKQRKEYTFKFFSSAELVTEFLNATQDEIFVTSITHTNRVYTVFYYKKVYK